MFHVVLKPRAGFYEREHKGRVDSPDVIDSKEVCDLLRLCVLIVDVLAFQPWWHHAPMDDVPPPTPELLCAFERATAELHVGDGLAEPFVPLDQLRIHL